MPKVVVCSDQHLGYVNSKDHDFGNFLDYITKRNDTKTLVVLGDLVDMWRRDVSGLFLEYSGFIEKFLKIRKAGIKIFMVAGNHDYHLLRLQSPSYQFEFCQDLVLPSGIGGLTYVFKHGWEFDFAQQPLLMEALCHNMSDEAGDARSRIYNSLMILKDHISDLVNFHGGNEGYVKHLMTPPEERLKQYLTSVEAKACSSHDNNEILVFGHTHRPFVSDDKRVINTGSWICEPQSNYIFNTFAELDGDQISLMHFVDDNTPPEDITSKQTFPCPDKSKI